MKRVFLVRTRSEEDSKELEEIWAALQVGALFAVLMNPFAGILTAATNSVNAKSLPLGWGATCPNGV